MVWNGANDPQEYPEDRGEVERYDLARQRRAIAELDVLAHQQRAIAEQLRSHQIGIGVATSDYLHQLAVARADHVHAAGPITPANFSTQMALAAAQDAYARAYHREQAKVALCEVCDFGEVNTHATVEGERLAVCVGCSRAIHEGAPAGRWWPAWFLLGLPTWAFELIVVALFVAWLFLIA